MIYLPVPAVGPWLIVARDLTTIRGQGGFFVVPCRRQDPSRSFALSLRGASRCQPTVAGAPLF